MGVAPYLLGRKGPGAAIVVGGGSGDSDGGFVDEPVVTTTSTGDTTVKGKVKAGSFGKFVYPMATITAGRQYTFRYTPQFSQLAQQGKLAMVGFGLKNGNDFHIVGLRGDGSTGLNKYKVYGTPPAGWNAQTGHTTSDGGAAAAGTQAGPNYIRLIVSADGTTYTFQTSTDGTTWNTEYSGSAPSPFSNVSGVTTFGLALWFNNADAGPFSIVIDQFANVVVATPSYWNAGGRGDRTASLTVTTTATLGAGTINNLVDGGFGANSTDACWFTSGQTLREVKFDWGSGVAKIINGFRWVQDATNSHGTWVFEGSNDDSTYTQIGSSFTLGGTLDPLGDYPFVNSTAYRYYKLRQTAGSTSSVPWLREIEFRVADPAIGEVRDALEAGDRTSLITVTTTATMSSSTTIADLIDGNVVRGAGNSAAFSAESLREIKFDLGSGVTKILTAFLWLQGSSASHGTWVFEGSNDDSSYTGLGSSFTLGASTLIQLQSWANTTAYRYYKLRQTSGTTSSSPWLFEIEFKIT